MKILYIERSMPSDGIIKDTLRLVRSKATFSDQDGFFEQSLFAAADTTQVSLSDYAKHLRKNEFDAFIVNWKQQPISPDCNRSSTLKKIADKAKIPTAIFVGAAEAGYLPPEDVLDKFDVIFKREPFQDRSKYNISDTNKRKIVPTMISCPFVRAQKPSLLGRLLDATQSSVQPCCSADQIFEVGFSGADAAEHTLRRGVWRRVKKEGFSTIGGLQPNPYTKQPIPDKLQGPRFKGRAYRDSLCQAKVNLALDGIGEYTFRHQELLYLGKFMLSHSTIRELELPMPLEENQHYVAFDDFDDMVEKIRFYLEHDSERQKIAAAGKELFDAYYDPVRHGQSIIAALQNVR